MRSGEGKAREASISFEFAPMTLCQRMWITPVLWYPILLLGFLQKKVPGQTQEIAEKLRENLTEKPEGGTQKTSKIQIKLLELILYITVWM